MNNAGLPTLYAVENPNIKYSQYPYPWFCIPRFNPGLCSTVIFSIKKKIPRVSGRAKFKATLFKVQLTHAIQRQSPSKCITLNFFTEATIF